MFDSWKIWGKIWGKKKRGRVEGKKIKENKK